MALKAHVCKENVTLPTEKLFVDDLVFVGDGSVPGHKCISAEDAKLIPKGYLEPALDAEVQAKTKEKADEALAKAQVKVEESERIVKAAEAELKNLVKRKDLEIKHLRYQAGLTREELQAEEARHAATLKAFGIEAEDEAEAEEDDSREDQEDGSSDEKGSKSSSSSRRSRRKRSK